MARTILLLLAAASLWAADTDFNGRWNIRVEDEARSRAWWLEVTGAGTPTLQGRFVGFPGGDTNRIEKIALKDGVLRFTFERAAKGRSRAIRNEYTARLVNGTLEGTCKSREGLIRWTGRRAPEIADRDDGSWREGQPIHLFNGKDLTGWRGQIRGRDLGWVVEDGILKGLGKANNIETEAKFWNFVLHVEYRVAPRSNSGIGLRGRYEVQILDDAGRTPNTHTNGALYSKIAPAVNASKPAGEWQTFDIRIVGRDVTIVLNGQQVVKGVAEGPTAISTDPDEDQPGPISLQGDHGPVEFRKIILTPLVKN